MEKYIIRSDSSDRFIVMSKDDKTNIYFDVATAKNEYWACRIVDALIFENKLSKTID